ncbi:RNA-binding protein [Oculatella sp. LEGE 06141]|uniref:RNA recognition motif domain-containing protein n=1 Tax=Oculatella sp. LEGE 06141 TaxID=1828648 RepID=UPI00187E18C7|nr:RNA-binding protein [Oculatella sp. LEGE 06141]MBE9180515.1 RNA-binding protein [Oculatella sp. LEGE 06141]
MSIYIGNLSYEVTQDDLNAVFAEYGTVTRVHLPTDRETGRPRGFGFVEMSADSEEDAAIAALDGAEWMGRNLRVNKAKPREERPRNDRNSFNRSSSRSGSGWNSGSSGYSQRY